MNTDIILPILRKELPRLIAENIIGCQPMSEESGKIFSLKHEYGPYEYTFGTVIHSFIDGWCIETEDGNLPFDVFIDKYGTSGIIPINMKEKLSQWYYNEKAGIKFPSKYDWQHSKYGDKNE